MKTNHFYSLITIAFVAFVVAGCASAPSRFYTLNSTATPGHAPTSDYAIVVGPVSLPAEVDRPQMTLRIAPNRVEIEEFNRWAAPLNENIARVIAENLALLLGTPRVATTHLANFNPTYRVSIDFQRFESVRDEATKAHTALVEAVWVVRIPAANLTRFGRTVVSEPAPGDSFDALAAAHSRALAKVSADIAAAIQAESGDKP